VSDSLHDMLRERVDIAVRYGRCATRRWSRGGCTSAAHPGRVARLHRALRRAAAPARPGAHNCIALLPDGRPQLQWTFTRDGQSLTIKANGNRRADDARWCGSGRSRASASSINPGSTCRPIWMPAVWRADAEWRCDEIPLHAIVRRASTCRCACGACSTIWCCASRPSRRDARYSADLIPEVSTTTMLAYRHAFHAGNHAECSSTRRWRFVLRY